MTQKTTTRQHPSSYYAELMRILEPDIADGLDEDTLRLKYAEETPEEHEERMKRYRETLETMDTIIAHLERSYVQPARRAEQTKKEKIRKSETGVRERELQAVEQLLHSDSDSLSV